MPAGVFLIRVHARRYLYRRGVISDWVEIASLQTGEVVMPAKAGIQVHSRSNSKAMDSGRRRNAEINVDLQSTT